MMWISVEIGLETEILIEIDIGTAVETEIGIEEIEIGEIAMLIGGIGTVIETEIGTETIDEIGIVMAEVQVGTVAGGKEIVVTIAILSVVNLPVRSLLKLIVRNSVSRERSTTLRRTSVPSSSAS